MAKRGCKICHAVTLELDSTGRCLNCAAVKAATDSGTTYGKFMAAQRSQEPETVIPEPVEVEPEIVELPAIRPCACCGKPFFHRSISHKYCGPECQKVAKREQARVSARKKNGPAEPRHCPICNKEFPPEMDLRQIACPGECTWIYRKRRAIERRAAAERKNGNG